MAEVPKRILAKNLIISQNSSGLTTVPHPSEMVFLKNVSRICFAKLWAIEDKVSR